ncbi:MAG: LysR family transcriptional regulator [Panacagrimonas sp.]
MDALQAYTAFVRTFEAGSFSAVARELGTSQSGVSKQIAALELSLGVQLFARTTRRLQPTAEALKLYEHVRQLLDAVESLKSATGRAATASGTLKVTMPSSYARRRICPKLPQFLEKFPQVNLDVRLTDQVVDLVEEGLELGVRIGDLSPSTLIARPIGIIDQLVVATPKYLAKRGVPESPQDLAAHSCVLYSGAARWTRWEFESETGRHAVEVSGPVRVNDPDAMFEFVLAHQGIALIPDWVVGDEVESGKVRWLLQDYYPIPMPVNIVYPQTRFLSHRARSFIDFFVAEHREKKS